MYAYKHQLIVRIKYQHPDYDYDPFGVPRYDVSVAHVETITFDEFTAVT